MKHFTNQDIQELSKYYRANLINSVSGYKPANLIGTISAEGKTIWPYSAQWCTLAPILPYSG
jgi:hypothetical protein